MEQSPQASQASQPSQSPQVIQGPPPPAPSSDNFEFDPEGGDEVAQALAHASKQEVPPAPAADPVEKGGDPEDVSPREMRSAEYAELARERAKLAKREKEFAAREAKLKEFESLSKRDKIAALKALGYDDARAFLEDIARNGGQPSPEQLAQMELKAQLDAIKSEREQERARAEAERVAAQEREATASLQNDISTFLKADPKYSKSFLTSLGGDQAIFQVMQKHYQETAEKSRNGRGEVLSIAKAAEIVENNIRSAAKALAGSEAGKALLRELLGVDLNPAAPARVSKPAKTTVTPEDEELDGDLLLEKATRFLKNGR